MKRFTVLGLCLTVAFALSAMIAASAQAGTEHGPLTIKAKGGEAHLGLSSGVEVHSTSNKGQGVFDKGFHGTARSLFLGVQQEPAKLPCNSEGQPSGSVETENLVEETGNNEATAKHPAGPGVDFKAEGALLAKFACQGGSEFEVKGSVVAYDDPANVPGVIGTLSLLGVGFKNEPENFTGGPPDFLESVVNKTGGALHSGQFQTDELEPISTKPCKAPKHPGEEPKCKKSKLAELNTVFNPLRPEVGRCNKQAGGKYANKECTAAPAPGKKGKYEFNPAGE